MMQFLVTSLVLTVVLNLGIRMIPGVQEWIGERMRSMTDQSGPRHNTDDFDHTGQAHTIEGEQQRQPPRVKVFFPWKAMLIGSIILTVLVNVFGAFR